MKYSCLYSIVRFAPHAETEEFANVGIVLTAPAYGRMEYRLARRNWKRVNQFFECPQLFAKALVVAQNELENVRLMTAQANESQIVNHFRYLTEHRESLIRFSPMRSILADDFTDTLNNLYERFIERQIEPRARREEQMVKEIRTLFSDAAIRNFRDETLTGELTKLHLPLVHRNKVIAAIKPLAFDQAEPSAILDHCEQWVIRLARAEREGILKLENVLIPVTAPYSEQTPGQRKAVDAARQIILKNRLPLVEFEQTDKITAFAQQFS